MRLSASKKFFIGLSKSVLHLNTCISAKLSTEILRPKTSSWLEARPSRWETSVSLKFLIQRPSVLWQLLEHLTTCLLRLVRANRTPPRVMCGLWVSFCMNCAPFVSLSSVIIYSASFSRSFKTIQNPSQLLTALNCKKWFANLWTRIRRSDPLPQKSSRWITCAKECSSLSRTRKLKTKCAMPKSTKSRDPRSDVRPPKRLLTLISTPSKMPRLKLAVQLVAFKLSSLQNSKWQEENNWR